jgi:hypothetical protein
VRCGSRWLPGAAAMGWISQGRLTTRATRRARIGGVRSALPRTARCASAVRQAVQHLGTP